MDYNALLDMATDLGYELAMSGAETFRIEESINRVLAAYGVASEVFAIPNNLLVSIETPDGHSLTRMRRIGYHGNDLDGVEKFNGLSRVLCNRKPDPQEGKLWLDLVRKKRSSYSVPVHLMGNLLGAFGFALFFGGSITDALWAGLYGVIIGVVGIQMNKFKVNPFFSTIISGFIMSFVAYLASGLGLVNNVDTAIIGALMILVPGLLFTNAMRDIIYGDTNSGVNRVVQVIMIALAIALGTASAWRLVSSFLQPHLVAEPILYSGWLQCIFTLIGCIGFAILFNVHSMGIWLCALGGVMTWAVYLISVELGSSPIFAYFWAAMFSSAYSEIMARIRKYPAISYLVVSIFPLLPGAGIYYTVSFMLAGNMDEALKKGLDTAYIAGVMAVGILLISTLVRLFVIWKVQHKK